MPKQVNLANIKEIAKLNKDSNQVEPDKVLYHVEELRSKIIGYSNTLIKLFNNKNGNKHIKSDEEYEELLYQFRIYKPYSRLTYMFLRVITVELELLAVYIDHTYLNDQHNYYQDLIEDGDNIDLYEGNLDYTKDRYEEVYSIVANNLAANVNRVLGNDYIDIVLDQIESDLLDLKNPFLHSKIKREHVEQEINSITDHLRYYDYVYLGEFIDRFYNRLQIYYNEPIFDYGMETSIIFKNGIFKI